MLRYVSVSLALLLVSTHVAGASVVITVGGPSGQPGPAGASTETRIQAIDCVTGQVAFDRIVSGVVQSAILSDSNEVVYSVGEIGTSLTPRSSLFVQPIGQASTPPVLTYDGPIRNLGATYSRLVWQDDVGIKVRARSDGATQSFGSASSSQMQISGSYLIWYESNYIGLNQYTVKYMNLDTNDFYPYLFWNRGIQSLSLTQHQRGSGSGPLTLGYGALAISGGQVFADNEFGVFNQSNGGTLVPTYDDSGTPHTVSSLKTNGEQMAFKDVAYRNIDEHTYAIDSSLYLSNAGHIVQLAGPQSGEYALATDVVAWIETVGGIESLLVHDIPGDQTRTLPVDASDFHLLDMNSRYVLVTSQVPVPEPAICSGVAVMLFLLSGVWRGRVGACA